MQESGKIFSTGHWGNPNELLAKQAKLVNPFEEQSGTQLPAVADMSRKDELEMCICMPVPSTYPSLHHAAFSHTLLASTQLNGDAFAPMHRQAEHLSIWSWGCGCMDVYPWLSLWLQCSREGRIMPIMAGIQTSKNKNALLESKLFSASATRTSIQEIRKNSK